MTILKEQGVGNVFHFAPLHYLPFIARSKKLLSKPSLKSSGFSDRHFRSKSSATDIERGFGAYVHLTLHPAPPILSAKLEAGFPHVAIVVSDEVIDAIDFNLCRYNVAMTRQLRRDGHSGFPESETNGRYYDGHQIPIARENSDKTAMLRKHLSDSMIEVLVPGALDLPDEVTVKCFSERDREIARNVLKQIGSPWQTAVVESPVSYPINKVHQESVDEFIKTALSDPNWKGDGLEFDKV